MTQLNDTYLRCIQACQECILRCEVHQGHG